MRTLNQKQRAYDWHIFALASALIKLELNREGIAGRGANGNNPGLNYHQE